MPVVYLDGVPHRAKAGERLSACLHRLGIAHDHPCGGRGTCKKCTVTVNGRAVLSCQYTIDGDVEVSLAPPASIVSEIGAGSPVDMPAVLPMHVDLALDIGTTTLALAAVSPDDGRVLCARTANNPQRAFGADVMSRIAYARDHGVGRLTDTLRETVNALIRDLLSALSCERADRLFAAGNTTMLHLFLAVDPTPMGTAPYTPAFLEERRMSAETCGIEGVETVITLPGMAAFVGADLVAGLHYVGLPPQGKYRLLIDLGTNAEILLVSSDRILCTAAAAGPCFEGASISCGMSATEGAIYAYDADGTVSTIGDAPARGVCGTGLLDIIAALLDTEMVDETGYMEPEAFYITDAVSLTREDVRQYQLAKSAVCAAVIALMQKAHADFDDVEQVFIAGGFASKLRMESAVRTGLLPSAFADRCTPVGNSSLLGTVKYMADAHPLDAYVCRSDYVDLAADPVFTEAFMEHMMFE